MRAATAQALSHLRYVTTPAEIQGCGPPKRRARCCCCRVLEGCTRPVLSGTPAFLGWLFQEPAERGIPPI
jgi:hypothetical protein